jgi:putative addiction module CopG family antidote
MKISFPAALSEWIEERVGSGRNANARDNIRDLVRSDHERRERLVRTLIEGEESGPSDRTMQEIIAAAKSTVDDGQKPNLIS